MHALVHYCRTVINGLLWFIETGWDIWVALFSALPYGDPYIAAAAMSLVFVVVDRVVRPRPAT
jgi:hypothetical protein